tara:strand:- start:213 stop:653 length:441 start_codon:yes stop_codon:yes gene_type:complete
MADFSLLIRERINLNGTERGNDCNLTIPGINYVDNRVMNAPSGSETEIFSFGDSNSSGTFVTSSLKYARITNLSSTVPINLKITTTGNETNYTSYLISTGSSFMFSTTESTGSITTIGTFTYDNISNIKIEPSGSNAKIEYFIATT